MRATASLVFRWTVCAAVLVLVAAGCGDDDDTEVQGEQVERPAGEDDAEQDAGDAGTIGYVVAGDRNDRGFYQGQVEAVEAAADELGFELIVVDKVNPGAAREAFENLCRQGPDLIIGGGSELTDGFVPVSASPECADITWMLVAGFPPTEDSYSTVGANENEAHFMGGVAAGLLLQRAEGGGDVACVVGGPDLPFVRNMEANMTRGLESVAPDKEMIVTLTGDFEDAALATEALQAQIDRGCRVFYPYLGGALPAAVEHATGAGIDVVATSVNRCGDPSGNFAMSILYNPALFLGTVIQGFSDGEITEGEQFALYGVGDAEELGLSDPNEGVGAVICDATPEEQQVLDDVRTQIANGEVDVGPAG